MDRNGRTVFHRSLRLVLIAGCVSVVAVPPVRSVEPANTAPAIKLADGIWTMQGPGIPGARHCGDWLVRLTNAQGHLSGVVSHGRATVPIENLTLMPDGSFTGVTRAGLIGTRHERANKITGRFSGDTVNLTLVTGVCPPRQGVATRRAAGG
jgi:hypothetical protein